MSEYRNYMETLVEEAYEECRDSLNCCTCEQCRNDIIACALNRLPPRYVVTQSGMVYMKLNGLQRQYHADIVTALAQAAKIVSEKPRH